MSYGIHGSHKIGKQNRKQLDNTTDPSSALPTLAYSYDRSNENTDPNTTVVLPPHFDSSIQTQPNSASDDSACANCVASDGLYQSTNHHGNTDKNDSDDLQ